MEFEEVVLLMQGQTPRVFPEAFRAARFSTGHLILCLISIAMGLFGILLAYIGLVSLDTFAFFFEPAFYHAVNCFVAVHFQTTHEVS